jgi:lysophospholipase L1-like esterase
MLKRIESRGGIAGGVAAALFLLLAMSAPGSAQSEKGPRWVGTWAASPMRAEGGFSVHPFAAVTLREIAHISNGGSELRVRFTNEFGLDPLTIGNAHVALSAGGGTIEAGTDHALTFGGAKTVTIPPGAVMYSDPVAMDVAPFSNVAVSFYLPSQVMRAETFHDFADQDNYEADEDVTGATALTNATTLTSWYFLDGIDVPAVDGARAIVALGDSITDGTNSTPNTNRRWPDDLARRLKLDAGANPGLGHVAVLNEGIGGNRVLNDEYGPSALARLDRDLLAQDGVRYAIVLESINDIGRLEQLQGPEDEVTAAQLELGLKQIVEAAHEHGMKAYGATLTPFEGAFYYSDKGETVREEVNHWIRTSGTFDAVIDFDKITRDPATPNRFNPEYDSGDHLHPNDAGYKAMADGIDLKLFAQ